MSPGRPGEPQKQPSTGLVVCVLSGGSGGGGECDFCSIFVPSPDISSWSPLILHLCFHLLISSPQIL